MSVELPPFIERILQVDYSSLFDPEVISKVVRITRLLLIAATIAVLILTIRYLITSNVSSIIDQALVMTTPGPIEQSPTKQKHSSYEEIIKRNIFGPIAVAPVQPVAQPEVKPISKLPLILVGTYVTGEHGSYAIIENEKSKEQDAFSIGDKIFEEAKLTKVFTNKVEIERAGEIETLLLDDSAGDVEPGPDGVANVSETEFVIDGKELDSAIQNLPLLLQQARAVPYFKNGQSVGLRMFAIRPDSLYTKIGLKNGDILMNINGKSLADLSEAIKLFETMKSERSFTLVLERNRETREFKYEVR